MAEELKGPTLGAVFILIRLNINGGFQQEQAHQIQSTEVFRTEPPALPHWHAPPPSSSRMDSPAIFWIKWSCNTDLSKTYVMVCPRPRSCDAPRALMSITPNHFCDETRTKEHTLAWHLCRDSGLTWLKQPPRGGQAQQEPNSAKLPPVEAEHEENPEQGKWQEAHCAGNWDSEKRTQQKAHAAQPQTPEDLWLR